MYTLDVDRFQLMKFTVGLILFLYAETLSKNQIFYYLCGITFGICGSIVILIYLISRIFPNVGIDLFILNYTCN